MQVPIQISFKNSEQFFAFLVNIWPKLFSWDNTFCFEGESHAREITEPFRKINENNQWFERKCPVYITGCMVISNLVISLVTLLSAGTAGRNSCCFWHLLKVVFTSHQLYTEYYACKMWALIYIYIYGNTVKPNPISQKILKSTVWVVAR